METNDGMVPQEPKSVFDSIKSLDFGEIKTLNLEQTQINSLTSEQINELDLMQRQALWEREKELQRELLDPTVEKYVDSKTSDALVLAQDAINFTQHSLVYRSANQIEHVLEELGRDNLTPIDGQLISRVKEVHKAGHFLQAQLKKHPPQTSFPEWLTPFLQREIIYAAVANYYRAGNCDEHAALAFCYLAKFAPPGTTISYCSSNVMKHSFLIIEGVDSNNHPFKVVCDPWPANGAQAVLWEDHECYFRKGEKDEAYTVDATFEVTSSNKGIDLMAEVFKYIPPDVIKKIVTPDRLIEKMSSEEIELIAESRIDRGVMFADQFVTRTQSFQGYISQRVDEVSNQSATWHFPENFESLPIPSDKKLLPILVNDNSVKPIVQLNPEINWPQPSIANQAMTGSVESIFRAIDESRLRKMAKKAGMSQGIQIANSNDVQNEVEAGSEVIYKSDHETRAYVRREVNGASRNHWMIVRLESTEKIAKEGESEPTAVASLVKGDRVGGKVINTLATVTSQTTPPTTESPDVVPTESQAINPGESSGAVNKKNTRTAIKEKAEKAMQVAREIREAAKTATSKIIKRKGR